VQFDRFRWYPIKVAAELIGDAGAPHAIARAGFAGRIKHLGKSRLPEDGKRHINKSGEWKMQRLRFCMAQPGGSLNGTSHKRQRPGGTRALD
jgi:hypothetical protein